MTFAYPELIVRDTQICGGEPVVRGTRVPVRTIPASLAEGAWIDEILADFPTLRVEQIRAVIERSKRHDSSCVNGGSPLWPQNQQLGKNTNGKRNC